MLEILGNRAIICITGVDCQKFLQGQTTNDIIKNTYSYNYLLTNQGRYLFDFFIYQQNPKSYFIDIDKESAPDLLKRLMLYKLRSDIDIKDLSDEYDIIYSRDSISSDAIYSFQDPRYKKLGFRTLVKSNEINNLESNTDNLYIIDKYKYGIADGSCDLIKDKSIPLEYGAQELCAINYQKGCYVGQEVISRAKYQGVIRKKIFKLDTPTDIKGDVKGEKIIDDEGNIIGIACSSYKNQIIALLREEKVLNLSSQTALLNETRVNIEVPKWRSET